MNNHATPTTTETRIQAIGAMISAVRLAENEIIKAGARVAPHFYYRRNWIRVQSVSVQLGDLVRELTIELRKAEDAAAAAGEIADNLTVV